MVTGIIFLVIAALHAVRLALGWEAMIGGWQVPMWLSVVAVVVATALGVFGVSRRDES